MSEVDVMPNVTRTATLLPLHGLSDLERAEQYRDKIGALLSQITDTMTDAKRHGLTVAFAIGTADAFGRFQIASLEISKKLA